MFFQPGLSFNTAFQDLLYGTLLLGEGSFNPVFWTLKIEFIGSIYLLLFYIAKPKGHNFFFMAIAMFLTYVTSDKMAIPLISILAGSLLNIISIPKKWYLPILACGIYFGAFQYESNFYNFLPSIGKGKIGFFIMLSELFY